GHDAHSFAFNPGFTAETPYLVNNPRLNGTALPLAEVNDDMLGNPRGTAPDIGAVEFSPAGVNITLDLFVLENKRFEAGSHQIDVVVRNNGAVPVTSFAANWKANETVQPVYLWTGSLAP